MIAPLIPPNERERLRALHNSGLLDSGRERSYDRLTQLARQMFGASAAFVSLIDADRQWFKSAQGADVCETERATSFCGHTILEQEVMVVEDARQDSRFAGNPSVTGEPYLRFYAGAQLRSDNGYNLGALCIIDQVPRAFSDRDRALLRALADCVEELINQARTQELTRRLLHSEQQLRALFELSPFGIARVDYASGRFLDVNPALVAATGYSRDALLAMDHWQLTPYEFRPAKVAALETMVHTGHYGPLDIEYQRADASRYPVRLRGILLDQADGRPTVWKLVEDISERVRVERMQREFVSTVSHELRTPLTAINGALRLIDSGALGGLPDAVNDLISLALRNGAQLATLINDLLDMEKLNAGKMVLDASVQPVAPIVEEAIADNASYGADRRVGIAAEGEFASAQADVDHQRLRQSLSNLLSNAVKFSPAQGEVRVRVDADAHWITVSVADDGPGVPESFKARIFQRFSQADGSDSRPRGGTGLGLAITRELIERMGGSVGFESEEGQGARFWIRLPRVHSNQASTRV